jgi:hypothetical protein
LPDTFAEIMNANNHVICSISNNDIILKDKYVETLKEDSKYDIKNGSLLVKNTEREMSNLTISKIKTQKKIEKHFLGQELKTVGLRPFFLKSGNVIFKGTSIATYLGFGIISLHIRIVPEIKMNFENAVALSSNDFSCFEVNIYNTIFKGSGIKDLCQIYKMLLVRSFGEFVQTYSDKIYQVLTSLDYNPNLLPLQKNEIFYYLYQPIKKDSKIIVKDNYVLDAIKESDVSNYSNLLAHTALNRMFICIENIYKDIENSVDKDKLYETIYESQLQFLIPLQKALGSMCILNSSRVLLENANKLKYNELQITKENIKLALRHYEINENYYFATVVEMIKKMRTQLQYDIVETNLIYFINSIDELNNERQRIYNDKLKNVFAGFIGLATIIFGFNAIESWIKLFQNLNINYAKSHPYSLWLIIWSCLFLIVTILFLVLIKKDNTPVLTYRINKSYLKLITSIGRKIDLKGIEKGGFFRLKTIINKIRKK